MAPSRGQLAPTAGLLLLAALSALFPANGLLHAPLCHQRDQLAEPGAVVSQLPSSGPARPDGRRRLQGSAADGRPGRSLQQFGTPGRWETPAQPCSATTEWSCGPEIDKDGDGTPEHFCCPRSPPSSCPSTLTAATTRCNPCLSCLCYPEWTCVKDPYGCWSKCLEPECSSTKPCPAPSQMNGNTKLRCGNAPDPTSSTGRRCIRDPCAALPAPCTQPGTECITNDQDQAVCIPVEPLEQCSPKCSGGYVCESPSGAAAPQCVRVAKRQQRPPRAKKRRTPTPLRRQLLEPA